MDGKRVRVVRWSLTAELRGKRPGYRPAARARGLLRHLRMRQRRNLEEV